MTLVKSLMNALKLVMGLSAFALIVMGAGLDGITDMTPAVTLMALMALIFGSAYKFHNYCAEWYETELDRQFYVQQKRNAKG